MSKYVIVLAVLVVTTSTYPAYAAQLDVVIAKNSEEFVPTFQLTRVVTIQYDKDSKLAELVGDTQHKVTFDIDSENAGILVDLINSELQEKSFVKVTDVSGEYSATISPQSESVGIEYKVVLRPIMQGHFIENLDTLDSQWRGFSIQERIPIETKYGYYDINSPKSVFDVTLPKAMEYLSDSDAMMILDMRLIDASGISELPLSKWESMFDPTAQMSETKQYGFSGDVITNYSMGICTVYLGLCQDKDFTEEFTIGEEKYLIRSIESQDDATIVIEGYVSEQHLGMIEVFTIQDYASGKGNENDTQVTIMYVMAGIGAAIAAGFFVWSSKKVNNTSTVQTGIDPKDLCATPIGSHAGSYQTNRGTAYLIEEHRSA